MGYPLKIITEAKGKDLTESRLKDGEDIASVEFDGVKEPCNGCKNKMQSLKDDTGVDVKYNWTEEPKTMFSTYSPNPNGTYSWQAK